MKKLDVEKMQNIKGGQAAFMTGLFCSLTITLSLSVVLAPIAGATGAGCAVGLYALKYWSDHGIDINKM